MKKSLVYEYYERFGLKIEGRWTLSGCLRGKLCFKIMRRPFGEI